MKCVSTKELKIYFSTYVDICGITVFVIVGTSNELIKTIDCLKKFEMKDIGRTKFCLKLEIEYLDKGLLLHQETYIMKVLKRF